MLQKSEKTSVPESLFANKDLGRRPATLLQRDSSMMMISRVGGNAKLAFISFTIHNATFTRVSQVF